MDDLLVRDFEEMTDEKLEDIAKLVLESGVDIQDEEASTSVVISELEANLECFSDFTMEELEKAVHLVCVCASLLELEREGLVERTPEGHWREVLQASFSRHWCMPNSDTFSMKPAKELLNRVIDPDWSVVDPFARNSSYGTVTNDLNPDTKAQYHLDASDFLDTLLAGGEKYDCVIFDPPYSPRQISECYQNVGRKVTSKDTQSSFYTILKRKLNDLLKPGGIAISFGWNSNGFGKTMGYKIQEIMLLAHGGAHNDTIIVVEKKIPNDLFESMGEV